MYFGKVFCERDTAPCMKVKVIAAQSCLTLCDPMDCGLPGSSVYGILQARILEWVAMPSSRGIFPTQGSNPGLLHCRRILYHLSHQRRMDGWKMQQMWHKILPLRMLWSERRRGGTLSYIYFNTNKYNTEYCVPSSGSLKSQWNTYLNLWENPELLFEENPGLPHKFPLEPSPKKVNV